MITDPGTNFVYLSGLLAVEPKYGNFWQHFKEILEREQIPYALLENTNDLWCRDYMPVQVEKDRFVQFRFDPKYYKEPNYGHLCTNPEEVSTTIPFPNPEKSTITLDGGNVVKWKDKAIMTEAVLKGNPHIPKKELMKQIKEVLYLEHLWLIPWQPYDSSRPTWKRKALPQLSATGSIKGSTRLCLTCSA